MWRPSSRAPSSRAALAAASAAALAAASAWLPAPGRAQGMAGALAEIARRHRTGLAGRRAGVLAGAGRLGDLSGAGPVAIDPLLMRSILLHSPEGFLDMALDDECAFLALLENRLLRAADGPVTDILAAVGPGPGGGEAVPRLVPPEAFFRRAYRDRCPGNVGQKALFAPPAVGRTLDGVKFPVPSGARECANIMGEWRGDARTPYLCGVARDVREGREAETALATFPGLGPGERARLARRAARGRLYVDAVGVFRADYMENLCGGLAGDGDFCGSYSSRDTWRRVVGGEEPAHKLSFKCRNHLGKEEATARDLVACAEAFAADPGLCRTRTADGHPSLFPRPDCRRVSEALASSNLRARHHDCPGAVGNASVTNAHRIRRHFDGAPLPADPSRCMFQSFSSYAGLARGAGHREGWPLVVCHRNRATERDDCRPFVPGFDEEDPLSENNAVAVSVRYLAGMPPRDGCRFVDSRDYNPVLLDYRRGCLVIGGGDDGPCPPFRCGRRVVYDGREVEGVEFRGEPEFSYFPDALGNPAFALAGLLGDARGRRAERTVRSLTELRRFLGDGRSIVHGVGCAGDLLPGFFAKRALNQCRPLPFIVDGHSGDGGFLVSVRTAIDDVHSPRLVEWADLHNAVASFQAVHPLKSWAMHVLR